MRNSLKEIQLNEETKLDNNKIDLFASATKGVLGAVPYVGSFLAELVGTLIPNQRIDRLAKYVKELDNRLAQVSSERIEELVQNEEFIDLVEEGFFQAARGISEERRKYIATLIANGTKYEELQLQQSKHLLKILQELNDLEIIWLTSFSLITVDAIEFKRKHSVLLSKGWNSSSSDEEGATKRAFQDSYEEHLQRLNLLEIRQAKDHRTNLPKFNPVTGEPILSTPRITFFGRLLLKQIELSNDD